MATLKKFNLRGEQVGEAAVSDGLTQAETSSQLIKDYIVAIRANARQWSASTKTRAEINRSKTKPRPQKGSGNARQGARSAPQYRGGGVVFGPRPKFDQHVKINRKERRQAIRSLLGEKIRSEHCYALDSMGMEAPKTALVHNFLSSLGIAGRSVLFIGPEQDGASVDGISSLSFVRSVKNLPKTYCIPATCVSGYDLARVEHVVIAEEALPQLEQWLA